MPFTTGTSPSCTARKAYLADETKKVKGLIASLPAGTLTVGPVYPAQRALTKGSFGVES